jgi:hypothetical protein
MAFRIYKDYVIKGYLPYDFPFLIDEVFYMNATSIKLYCYLRVLYVSSAAYAYLF